VYKISGNKVSNDYQFLFTNTRDKDYTFYFEIVGRDDIKIERPSKPFKIKAGQKTKKIIVLSTTKKVGTENSVVSRIPLTIRSYAVEAKDKVFANRTAIFAYPPLNEMK
jgi:hypothetical protein